MKRLFLDKFAGYSLPRFRRDLLAGLVVGVLAIPLGMGFAIASGVKPEFGIYTTITAGILISLLGGSKYQIGGPTGAFIPILFAIVMTYGYEKLLVAGFLAGVLLVLMGLLRLGSLIRYIPKPVTLGFTSGIAVLIFSGQIATFLGLRGIGKHEAFLANMQEIVRHADTLNPCSVLTASICFVVVLVTPKLNRKLPAALLGILISSLLAAWGYPGQVATIGSTYGPLSGTLPTFQVPDLSWDNIVSLIGPACMIAFLGGIESLLSAVIADTMTNTKHHSNRELIGQGIANLITPLFGGIPATGALARTAANIRTGATSPMSGIVHGLVVLLTLLLFAPYASSIPLASMAPVLMVVAWNMSERQEFLHVLRTKTGDSLILVATFLFTIFTNLTTAIEVGMALAVVLFTKRMADSLKVAQETPEQPVGVPLSIYLVEGPLFFGAAQTFEQSISHTMPDRPEVLLLRMGKVPFIDTTGESYLRQLVQDFQGHGGTVLISEIASQPKVMLQKTGVYDIIGADHFFERTADAIGYARWERGTCMDLEIQQFKAEFFKALAHPMRIRILELLASGDKSVNELQTLVESAGSAMSQQLSILRSKNIVVGTKDGNRVIYSLRDPMLIELLQVARQIFNNHFINEINKLDRFNED
jgi:SulP family sulfate permease